MALLGLVPFANYLIAFVQHPSASRHIQSLITGAVLFIGAMLLGALGVIGDLLDAQRTLSQRTFERVRRIELQLGIEPSTTSPAPPATRSTTPRDRPHQGPETPPGGGDPSDREALEV